MGGGGGKVQTVCQTVKCSKTVKYNKSSAEQGNMPVEVSGMKGNPTLLELSN